MRVDCARGYPVLQLVAVSLDILDLQRGQIQTGFAVKELEEIVYNALISHVCSFRLFGLESLKPRRKMFTDGFSFNRRAGFGHYLPNDTLNDPPRPFFGEMAGPSLVLNALNFRADSLCLAFVCNEGGFTPPD